MAHCPNCGHACSQTTSELRMPEVDDDLLNAFSNAHRLAEAIGAGEVTMAHLLYQLTSDARFERHWQRIGIDPERLNCRLRFHLASEHGPACQAGQSKFPRLAVDLRQLLQHARAMASNTVGASAVRHITVADVLAALTSKRSLFAALDFFAPPSPAILRRQQEHVYRPQNARSQESRTSAVRPATNRALTPTTHGAYLYPEAQPRLTLSRQAAPRQSPSHERQPYRNAHHTPPAPAEERPYPANVQRPPQQPEAQRHPTHLRSRDDGTAMRDGRDDRQRLSGRYRDGLADAGTSRHMPTPFAASRAGTAPATASDREQSNWRPSPEIHRNPERQLRDNHQTSGIARVNFEAHERHRYAARPSQSEGAESFAHHSGPQPISSEAPARHAHPRGPALQSKATQTTAKTAASQQLSGTGALRTNKKTRQRTRSSLSRHLRLRQRKSRTRRRWRSSLTRRSQSLRTWILRARRRGRAMTQNWAQRWRHGRHSAAAFNRNNRRWRNRSSRERATDAPPSAAETETAGGKKFYLSLDDDVVEAPSIGPKTARRLLRANVHTVCDLFAANPETVASKVGVRHITAKVVEDWQKQARLVCTIPWLRGTHAQLLVAAGFETLDAVSGADPAAVCAAVLRFAATREGQRLLRSGPPPQEDKIKSRVENSGQAEPARAA